jgi:DNA polymerase III subunit gamma/tau
MDVIEIDAATNTQIDKVRDVIIAGLGVRPARDRYKIFIIDEVHRLSPQSFDALLKSVEEPPPHVVFMMATTELEKVPVTIQSRSQVFELKAIGLAQIAAQLRADRRRREGIQIDEAALQLVARAGDGSMRDAQSALDQVLAFAGETITAEDVATVLGLVRRDVLLDIAEVVAAEDAAAAFAFAGRAVEDGYDLKLVVRELARLTRDLLVVRIDPSRASDPEIAAEGERDRLSALAKRFSHEDLMRAFDVLSKAEFEIRASAHPRYHLEMALLRWIHLRQLVPLSDLIQGLEKGGPAPPRSGGGGSGQPCARAPRRAAGARPGRPAGAARPGVHGRHRQGGRGAARTDAGGRQRRARRIGRGARRGQGRVPRRVRRHKKFFYGTVVAQAQRIDVEPGRIVFTFGPQHRALRAQVDQAPTKAWLETLATKLAGQRMAVVAAETAGPAAGGPAGGNGAARRSRRPNARPPGRAAQQALADEGVQAMLDVFAADIKDVREL